MGLAARCNFVILPSKYLKIGTFSEISYMISPVILIVIIYLNLLTSNRFKISIFKIFNYLWSYNHFKNLEEIRPVGYSLLQQRHKIATLPHFVSSGVTERATRRSISEDGKQKEIYPRPYWPGETDFDHLEFALKYEGLNLPLLRSLLPRLDAQELTKWIASKPTGAYARRIWFLFEELTSKRLDLPDLSQGNYVELADSDLYYTVRGDNHRRQRINFNLLGDLRFCFVIRRTEVLSSWIEKQLDRKSSASCSGNPSRDFPTGTRLSL